MKKLLSIALTVALAALNTMSAAVSNIPSEPEESWPAPLTFKSPKTTRTPQGLYNTVSPLDKGAPTSARTNKITAMGVSKTLNLCGSLLYSTTWSTEARYGVYSVPTNSRQTFNCLYSTPLMVHTYWENKDGIAYVVAEESFGTFAFYTMYIFDTETGEKLETINLDNSNLVFTDLAEDPTTGDIYGCGVGSAANTFNWRKVNFETRQIENIAKLPGQLIGVGCDKNGQYYAMGTNTMLYKVEKTTGALTPFLQTDIPAQYNVGGCYNDDNNTFLQTSSTDDFGRLYEVDITSGTTSMIYEFPGSEEVTNLHFQKPLAEPKAPAAGEMMIIPSDDGSLTVEALLTMPETLFDESAIKPGTSLTYFIDIDGVIARTGNANAGEDVSTTVTAKTSGIHSFAFYTENEVGKSPKVYDSGYVGSAVPEAPSEAKLTLSGETATISWEASTKAVSEGYFDASKVKYVVKDATGTQVAGPTSALSVNINVSVPDKFSIMKYSVQSVMNDAVSEQTATNGIILGDMETPCQIDAREKDFFDSFKIFDSNDDGCSWIYDGYNTGYTNTEVAADRKQKANDWLITNGIRLKANHYYNVSSVLTTTSWMGANETLDIMCGASQSPDAMSISINPATIVSGFTTLNGTLSVPSDGVYYLGYHVTSEKGQEGLSLQWVNIGEGVSFTAPAAPEEISGTADIDGDPKATLSFRFPSKTMDGNSITGSLKTAIYAGGKLLKEVVGNPGEVAKAEVAVPSTGLIDFELKAINEAGEIGKPATIRVSIGPRKPATPSSVNAYQTENGKILITWTPVTVGTDNKAIKEEYMSYNIHFATGGYVGDLIESGVTGDSYVFDSGINSGQEFYQFVVVPNNRGVTGTGKGTYQTPTGVPYEVPFSLSQQNDLSKYIVAVSAKETELGFVADQQNIASVDGDGQFIGMTFSKFTSANATYGRLYTGLIKLNGVNPTLNFYVYKFGNDDDNYSTCGIILDGKYIQLLKVNNSTLPKVGWNKVSVSLDNYGGRIAQLDVRGYYNGKEAYKLYAVDAIKITNVQRYDISASVEASKSVEPGKPFSVKAIATNVGSKDAGTYTLSLYRGEELLKSMKFTSLAADADNSFSVTEVLNVTDPTGMAYKAEVSYDMDRNNDNNVATVTVIRNLSTLPGIDNLTAVRNEDGNVQLNWSPKASASDADYTLKGYNVYADGVKVNNSPVIETSYTHNSSLASEYRVSALYQEGESELSEPVMLSPSGINAVLDGGVRISVQGLRIKITGAEQHYITIVSADGSLIYSNRGDADVEVIPGIYMIDISGQTIKAIVR